MKDPKKIYECTIYVDGAYEKSVRRQLQIAGFEVVESHEQSWCITFSGTYGDIKEWFENEGEDLDFDEETDLVELQ